MNRFAKFALIALVVIGITLITRNLIAGFMTMTFLGLLHGVRVANTG